MGCEKKYKEVLDRARELYDNPNSSSIGKSYLYAVFPELKQNKDNRIKEDLIQLINEFPDTIWRGHYKKDVIDWLEKQDTEMKDAIYMDVNSETELVDIHKFLRTNLDGEKVKLLIIREE